MVLTALRGALGFTTRLPIGRDDAAWEAFRTTPAAFPLAGYVVGALLAVPLALPLPIQPATRAFAFVVAVVALAGVNHVDGLADLGDAAAIHGSPADRRAVARDTTVGVGAVLAVATSLLGLALAGVAIADEPPLVIFGFVIAAEVGAKLAVAVVVCLGDPSHEGVGATFATPATRRDLLGPLAAAAPVFALGGWLPALLADWWPIAGRPIAGVLVGWPPIGLVAVGTAVLVALAVRRWARRRLGGVGGDVFGATNELARVAALHAGVIAWTLS